MSQFEFVAIPVSLILTFGIARLLSGFPYLLTGSRTYWVHTLWCVQALVNYLLFWWLFWNSSELQSWTLGSYLLTLLYPALCYIGAVIFMPGEASPGLDWHAYFFRARKLIFSVSAIATATLAATAMALHDVAASEPGVLVAYGFAGLYVVGAVSSNERLHQVIVLLNATVIVAGYAPLIYTPLGS